MFNRNTLSVAMATLLLSACGSSSDSNDQAKENNEVEMPKFALAYKQAVSGEAEYLLPANDLMQGQINANSVGAEQLGWNYYYPVGNTIFVSGYENFETVSYKLNSDGELARQGAFVFNNALEVFGADGDDYLLASDEPRDGTHTTRTLYTVSAESGHIIRQVGYSIFDEDTGTPGEGTVGWATALVVRGDELFVPFHKLDDQGWYTTPAPDEALVAIYDYPLNDGASPKAIISDDRTSHIGVNGSTTGLILTDSGDMYSFSNGTIAAGFSPASTKPSGILKIANGESDFAQHYFFNIEEATNGGSIFWMDYVGGNKAIARLLVDKKGEAPWSAFGRTNFNQKLVIIDLAAKTVTDVANVPLHAKRYSSPVEVVNGKVYVSIEEETQAYIYEVDIETATATQGAEIQGKTVKGVYYLAD
ncbi:DUF4374 domain-containing protein [Catenovulum sediminis]|uniref:DUF4374 domain-containing protein n=1 Tax=Catenovulum sediminis TaxID=1740262 RepID=UPI00117CDE99|nr:DUF4374 domain-containing protein [Catenovulum sediminis]